MLFLFNTRSLEAKGNTVVPVLLVLVLQDWRTGSGGAALLLFLLRTSLLNVLLSQVLLAAQPLQLILHGGKEPALTPRCSCSSEADS